MYSEYEIGDYERVFTLSDEIDHDKIVATVKEWCFATGVAESGKG